MTVTVRFAPSPTGFLHVGNARVALVNWLFARAQGGSFVLRLDDTDAERSTEAFASAIQEDLSWLGLSWDRLERQADRLEIYAAALEKLKASERVYPCYETAEELEFKRKRQMARGLPPIYDRAALKLSPEERAAFEAEGRRPHWRFLLAHEDVSWEDRVRGPVRFNGAHLGDPVLIRGDGTPLYTLPSVVDDIDFGITHVIRGEDHVANTAVQIQIFEALGAQPPAFAHLSLLTDAAGQGLSKRLGSLSLRGLREQGIEPMAINSLLAHLGSSEAVTVHLDVTPLLAGFDLGIFGRAAPKFDPAELAALNTRLLHAMPFERVAERLRGLGLAEADARFWEAIRPNLERIEDAAEWWGVVREGAVPVIDDPAFIQKAAALLPPEPWDQDTWKIWTDAVKTATGAKGKALFLPLRLALTGRDHGPELKNLLPLIGRDRALARLCGTASC